MKFQYAPSPDRLREIRGSAGSASSEGPNPRVPRLCCARARRPFLRAADTEGCYFQLYNQNTGFKSNSHALGKKVWLFFSFFFFENSAAYK